MTAVLIMGTANVTEAQNRSGATGAIIGAGIGAIAGAVMNRYDPAAGAALGGLIGAGVGYIAGSDQNRAYGQQAVVYQDVAYGNPNYNRGRYDNRNCNNGYYEQRGRYNDRGRDRRYNNGCNNRY